MFLRTIYLTIILTGFFTTTHAEENRLNQFSIGFELNEFAQDFGVGVQLTTPFFLSKYVAFRARGGVSWVSGINSEDSENLNKWYQYMPLRFAVVNRGYLTKTMRIYSEGGLLLILPSSDVSSEKQVGGYGIFGFEFLMGKKSPVSYYIELGATGIGASAEQLAGEPIYGNGFTSTVGFRWYPL